MGFDAFKVAAPSGKSAPPVSPEVSPSLPPEPPAASPEAPQEEQYVTSVTPSGIEVYYSWAPRRHYKLRSEEGLGLDWAEIPEVPSVTSVLGVLDKSGALTWWGMKVGVEGVTALAAKGVLRELGGPTDEIVRLLTEHKLTVNHVKDKAADRGVNVHGALEKWASGEGVDLATYPDHERGYVEGLIAFEHAVSFGNSGMETELMVGSLEHSYAGRFDLVLTLSNPVEVVTKTYPKRKPRIEEIPAGRYLLDLKTSKGVYNTHYLQLEAYEAAAVECGYQPTDHRGVIHVTADGRYELALNKDWTFEDFLAVRKCFQVMNERSVIQAVRDEFDAKDAA